MWLGPRAVRGTAAGCAVGSNAGRRRGPRSFSAERLLNRLAREDTGFNAAQRARLEALFEARRREFERIAGEMRQRFTAEQERLRAGMAEILTPEQMERFDRMRRRPRGGAGTRAGTRPARRAVNERPGGARRRSPAPAPHPPDSGSSTPRLRGLGDPAADLDAARPRALGQRQRQLEHARA